MCTRRVAIISSQALMGTVKTDLSEYISLFLLKPFRGFNLFVTVSLFLFNCKCGGHLLLGGWAPSWYQLYRGPPVPCTAPHTGEYRNL